MSERPKDCANRDDDGERQTVADVHRSQKISWLAVEVETAGRTAIVHLGKAPVNARAENPARPASWAELPEDAAPGGGRGMGQEHMIVDRVPVCSFVRLHLGSRDGDNLWLPAFAPILVYRS